jgi:diguanylate cyclase (GGDEF)-like protein
MPVFDIYSPCFSQSRYHAFFVSFGKRAVLRIISLLFVPVSLLAAAFYLYPAAADIAPLQLPVIRLLPPAIALFALGLCLRFNRSRLFFVLLSVTLAYFIMQWYLPSVGKVDADIIWNTLCLLLPFNIVVFSLLGERGIFSWWGASRFVLLLVPFLLVVGVMMFDLTGLQSFFAWRFFEQELLSGVHFSHPALAIMLLAVLILNGRLFAKPDQQNSALFGAVLAAIMMLHFRQAFSANIVFAAAAMLMLAVAVVQESWNMAYIDTLTGLPGRRALEEELLKLGGAYTIAMLDIDHFKRFNDRYGHDAGDQVLRMAAALFGNVAAGGKAFRYGGEEFTILFSGKRVEETIAPLEAVRRRVGENRFQLRKKERRHGSSEHAKGSQYVSVHVSIGVAGRSEQNASPQEVIQAADRALYRAKKQGRNRLCE